MRFSSSGLPVTPTLPWAMKALRRNTSLVTPVSSSPAFAPFMFSTGTLVPV